MVEKNDYIVIQAPMVTDMKLSGNRLVVYALIHGFCKDGEHEFKGSISYICEWTNLTRNTVIATLKSLVDDGLLVKHDYTSNGVKFCAYKLGGSAKIALPVQSAKDKIIINNKDNNNNSLFEQCWIAYKRKGSKKKALEQWIKMKDEDKELVLRHIQMYVGSRDLCYQKDFERYLRDNTFKEIIIKGNAVVFDPSKNDKGDEYKPEQSLLLAWDEKRKINIFIGFWDGAHIPDGYNDDNRPDGARITLNNARGTIRWNSQTKTWDKVQN